MSVKDILPLSLRLENRIGSKRGILLLLVLFLLLFLPWVISHQELFRQEGTYAAVAANYVENQWDPSMGIVAAAHDIPRSDVWPLYPAVVSLLYRCGLPMENALRAVAVIMLGILSLLSGITARIRSGSRAGIVAACCCFGTVFALDKGVCGGPESMAACFLLAAQLLFFHYGSRLADWNSAWISSAIFLSLGFLTSGPIVLLFFVFPLFFLRRPLSFAGKFRTPGFLAGVVLLAVVILAWVVPIGASWRLYADESGFAMISSGEYWRGVLLFPFRFPLWMMPWTLVMWLPFCVALQAISPVPVFSRYLRTLFFSMFALVWLLPGGTEHLLFFLLGPLSVLTGLTYEFGVRRYGGFLRKSLICGGIFFPLASLFILGITFLPVRFISFFTDGAKLSFRDGVNGYFWLVLTAVLLLTVLNFFYSCGVRRYPIWASLSLLAGGMAIVAATVVLPYRLMENDWRVLGSDIRNVLPENVGKVYKYDIEGMYSGLFYVNKPIRKLRSLNELDELEDTVYIISSRQPISPRRRQWTQLLPENYSCRGVPVSVWCGVRIYDDDDIEMRISDDE